MSEEKGYSFTFGVLENGIGFMLVLRAGIFVGYNGLAIYNSL